ncbi:MAG: hypothetical protein ACQEXJ_18620 [Myxococcota bacterium]
MSHWGLVLVVGWLAPGAPPPALLAVVQHGLVVLVAGLGVWTALAFLPRRV